LNKQRMLQNLMVVLPVSLLIAELFPGVILVTDQTTEKMFTVTDRDFWTVVSNEAPLCLLMVILALVICGTAIAFRITGGTKPLDQTIVGVVVSIGCYLLLQLSSAGENVNIHIVVFIVLAIELVLTILYRIGRYFSIFI